MKMTNHRTDGEIGSICNHNVTQPGTIGMVCNHHMTDGAPKLASVVNHDMRECNHEEELAKILGVFLYPGRALCITNPEDIIQLHSDMQIGWSWMMEHYRRIGIECTDNVIWNDDFNVAKSHPELELSTFFFGESANRVRPDFRRLIITKQMNQKNKLIQLAQRLQVVTPQTDIFDCKTDIELSRLDNYQYPCVLKISESVSGLGVVICHNKEELMFEIEKLNDSLPFQIQEYLDEAVFPSVQYFIGQDGHSMYITECCNFLEGSIHAGNWGGSSMPYRPSSVTHPIAVEMARQGMRGWFSFDTAFYQGRYYVIECNPRYTGASYPYVAAKKLGADFWAMKSYKTSLKSLSQLDLGALEFDPKKKEGWALINWGPLAVGDGKGAFLYVGKEENYKKSEDALSEFLA